MRVSVNYRGGGGWVSQGTLSGEEVSRHLPTAAPLGSLGTLPRLPSQLNQDGRSLIERYKSRNPTEK